jgi:hypothetical protein
VFFNTAVVLIQQDDVYILSDKVKYKSCLAIVHIAKFGNEIDAGRLADWMRSANLDRRQQYLGMRSLLYLQKRLNLPVTKELLIDYKGMYWRSVLTDLHPDNRNLFSCEELFDLIKDNVRQPAYVDYLIGLLTKIILPGGNYPEVLRFISRQITELSEERIFDKYLILALYAGADFDFFLQTIKMSVNPLNIKFSSSLHQRIAELATPEYMPLLSQFVNRLRHTGEDGIEPAWREVLNTDNRYFFIWIMTCAYCKLADRENIRVLVYMLTHKFFTVRKAAFDKIAVILSDEDFSHFLDLDIYNKVSEELKSAFFLLDFKTYLADIFETICKSNGVFEFDNELAALDLLPKPIGEPIDPEPGRERVNLADFEAPDEYELPF